VLRTDYSITPNQVNDFTTVHLTESCVFLKSSKKSLGVGSKSIRVKGGGQPLIYCGSKVLISVRVGSWPISSSRLYIRISPRSPGSNHGHGKKKRPPITINFAHKEYDHNEKIKIYCLKIPVINLFSF